MLRLYATAFAPIIGGLLLAVVAWLIARRSGASQGGATGGRLAPVLAGGIPLVLVITLRLWQYSPVLFAARLPRAVFEWLPSVQFILPLILGALGLVLLGLSRTGPRRRGVAIVARRTPWEFLPRGLTVTFAVLVAFAVALALAAGVASDPDPQGRYQQYTVDVGTAGMTLGNFYGWYYSIPAMIVLAVLLVFVLAHAVLVARPALAAGYQQKADVASRRRLLRNALLLVSGAVLLHLWSVLKNLADVAASSGMVSPTERSVFLFGPPFAALEPALSVAALCAYGLGVAAWAGVVLSAIPPRRLGKAPRSAEDRRPAATDTDPT